MTAHHINQPTTQQTTPHDTAISYTEQGWPVFPCRAAPSEYADPHTGELIVMGEKTPLTVHGFRDATKIKRVIERWWSDWPDAAVGLPTGSPTGFFALDIDNKPGGANGFDWLSDMESEHGPLPATAKVKSPNGGLHIYFKYVVGTRNRGALGAGVDIRSEGGYVLGAGSVMANGRGYEWVDDVRDIADAPPWLLELLLPRPAATSTHRGTSFASNSAYVDAAVERELAGLASMPMGNRNNALNDAAFAIGTFVGAGAITMAEARAQLQDVARGWGRDWARCCKTIENGLAAGAKNPRDIPEPAYEPQDNTRLVDITRMIAKGLAKKKAPTEWRPEREESAEAGAAADEKVPSGNTKAAANDNSPSGDILFATPFKWIDPKTIPRREFAFGTHYIRKYVSVTVAPGGLGKTANAVVEALSMTSGKELNGTRPPDKLKVWLFNAEDPRDELERRIMAAALHFKLKPDDFEGRLFLDSGREQELVIAREDKRAGVRIVEPVVKSVVSLITRLGIDVMIVDPFVSTHQVNENDNGAIDKVAKLWAQVANDTNCSIDIVHHLRKVADREATVEDARGAVSLIGAARSVRVLNRMTAEQATESGLKPDERFGMFSITYGKSNLTAMSNKLHWRKLESVGLNNARSLTLGQDFAPVVTEWRWPDKAETVEDVTAVQREEIAVRISNMECRLHPQSSGWVGKEIAFVMGWDASEKAIQKRLKRMVDAWLDDGFLAIESRRDPVKRENKDFVVVRTTG